MAAQVGGSNSLRGGKKTYGAKTKCGNWVELNKEPGQSLPSGFPHAMYKTDAQQQMLEGLLLRPRRYGAGLPPPEDPNIDYRHVMNYDKRQGDSKWAAITSTEFVPPGDGREKSQEFASSFRLTGGIADPVELKQYRDNWTVEVDAMRPVRFKTDAVISANSGVPQNFKVVQTRSVPGAPKAVDRLRVKVLEKSGANTGSGLAGLRQILTSIAAEQCSKKSSQHSHVQPSTTEVIASSVSKEGLAEGLLRLDIPFDDTDFKKVVHFFTEGENGDINIPAFFRGLHGPVSEHRQRSMSDAFQTFDEAGSGVVSAMDLKHHLDVGRGKIDNADDAHGELTNCRHILLQNMDLYQDGDVITRTGFEDLLGDAFCTLKTDLEFSENVKSAFTK